jgi:hypothetical protein
MADLPRGFVHSVARFLALLIRDAEFSRDMHFHRKQLSQLF